MTESCIERGRSIPWPTPRFPHLSPLHFSCGGFIKHNATNRRRHTARQSHGYNMSPSSATSFMWKAAFTCRDHYWPSTASIHQRAFRTFHGLHRNTDGRRPTTPDILGTNSRKIRPWLCSYTYTSSDTMLQVGRSRDQVPIIWICFNLPNNSSSTIALGSTQPLTKISTRNLPGG
jgi:hypothetical protein